MIEKKQLGSTDIEVSRIGLGTVKFGRNQGVHYPDSFLLPDDKKILELLDIAQQSGINLLDTAPAYGTSEERLGKLLKPSRHQWIISTKVGEEFIEGQSHFDFSKQAIQKSIERSLRLLKTDYVDIVLVHSNGSDKEIIEENKVFDTLNEIKKSGWIRAFGMSTKTIEGGKLAVAHSDVVMVTYNMSHREEKSVIEEAQKKNKGIFIKKGLVSGYLSTIQSENPILASMQFIFQEPAISSLLLGTINSAHLKENIRCAEQALSTTTPS